MGSRRHQSRREARRKPSVEVKERILIVSEGKVTEPQYLRQFANHCRNSLVEIEIVGGQGVPKTVVEQAIKRRQDSADLASRENDDNLSFDAVWCIFDADEHPAIPKAFQLAQQQGLEIAYSNPCIELWLLLHFQEQPGMQDRHKIQEMLKKHLPHYDKKVDFARYYAADYAKAKQRAERLDSAAKEDQDERRNPTTSVWRLTESIKKKS